MMIIDSVEDCLDDGFLTRDGPVQGIAIHRFGVPGCHDAAGVARFCRGEKAVGNRMSYSYVINHLGYVEQTLPDNAIGWHCRHQSRHLVGVALLGDFRKWPPQPLQWVACSKLCSELMQRWWLPPWSVVGHDEIVGGSSDPNKECPGGALNMHVLRAYLGTGVVKP